MRMKLNVWHGHRLGICWQHVAETRVSGFGKVSVNIAVDSSDIHLYKI